MPKARYAVYRARGAHGGPHVEHRLAVARHFHDVAHAEAGYLLAGQKVELAELCQHLYHSGAHAAGYVVEEKLLGPPYLLHHAAEHPQGEHVEQYVREAAVHEHVCEQLVEVEVAGEEEVQPQHVVEVCAHPPEHYQRQKHQGVDYQQILGYGRNSEHTRIVLSSYTNVGKSTKNIRHTA